MNNTRLKEYKDKRNVLLKLIEGIPDAAQQQNESYQDPSPELYVFIRDQMYEKGKLKLVVLDDEYIDVQLLPKGTGSRTTHTHKYPSPKLSSAHFLAKANEHSKRLSEGSTKGV